MGKRIKRMQLWELGYGRGWRAAQGKPIHHPVGSETKDYQEGAAQAVKDYNEMKLAVSLGGRRVFE